MIIFNVFMRARRRPLPSTTPVLDESQATLATQMASDDEFGAIVLAYCWDDRPGQGTPQNLSQRQGRYSFSPYQPLDT